MADELGVKVSAELDKAKTKENIERGLSNIKPDPIEVPIEPKIEKGKKLDTRSLEKDVENLKTKLSKSKITLDWTLFDKAFDAKNIKQAAYELTVLKKTYRNLNAELSAKLPNQAIEALPKSINEANTSVITLLNNFKNLKAQGVTVPESAFSNLNDLTAKLNTFSKSLPTVDISNPAAIKSALGEFRQITTGIDDMSNSYKLAVSQFRREKIDIGAENVQIDLQKIKSNLVSMQREWSAAMNNPEFAARFKQLFQIIDSGSIKSGAQVTNLRKEIQKFRADIDAAGLAQKTFWGKLTQNLQKFTSWFLIGGGVASAVRGLREMFTAVKDLDIAMTELRKVTEETNATYDKFLQNASTRAVELAVSLSDYVNSVSNFAKMGYSIPDSQTLADAATIYYNVGDGMSSMEDATQSLISTLKAYKLSASDATKVTDIFNEISNRFAVTSGGIGEGMQRAGAALATANTSLEKSVALWTAINEVIQNDESSATSLRFIAQRMRNTAGELEDMGEDADGAAESITKLQQQILKLTGVNIMADSENFRDIYDVLKDVSDVWEDISDKDQSDVVRLMAGNKYALAA